MPRSEPQVERPPFWTIVNTPGANVAPCAVPAVGWAAGRSAHVEHAHMRLPPKQLCQLGPRLHLS